MQGVPKKTHFQNCHQFKQRIVNSRILYQSDCSDFDNLILIDGNSESAFFWDTLNIHVQLFIDECRDDIIVARYATFNTSWECVWT